MNLKTQRQDLEKKFIVKIEEFCKKQLQGQRLEQNTIKHIFKMIVTDPELEDFFTYLIKMQVNKLKQTQKLKAHFPKDQTKLIKENIKTYIEQLIKKEFQKRQTNLNNDYEYLVDPQERVNKEQTYRLAIKQEQNLEQNKVENITVLISKTQNEINIAKNSTQNKRKIIKKQNLKSTHDKKYNKQREIIQIASQSQEIKTQKKSRKNQMKPCNALEKQAIPKKQLSFLPTKREDIPEISKTTQMGHFVYGDNVKTVTDIYYSGAQHKNIVLLIDWQQRRNGFKPLSSMVSLEEYQYYKPLQMRLFLKNKISL